MSVLQGDAFSMCLICHNDLNQGTGGTRELQCTHTFHKEVTHTVNKTKQVLLTHEEAVVKSIYCYFNVTSAQVSQVPFLCTVLHVFR